MLRILFIIRFRRRFNLSGFVHPLSVVGKDVEIGVDTNINGKAFIPDGTIIKGYCAIAHGLRIRTYSHRTNRVNISDYVASKYNLPEVSYFRGKVVIEDFVWIGDNVTIIGPVTIGRGAIVGAGSVVTKDVLPWSVNAGVPCRLLKMRFHTKVIERLNSLECSNSVIMDNLELFRRDMTI